MTDTHFGATVELEKRLKFSEFYVFERNSLSDFAIDELNRQEERKVL